MNRIIMANDDITLKEIDNNIEVEYVKKSGLLDVKLIKINVIENSELVLEYTNTKETKIEININVNDGINFNLYELKENGIYKFYYNYNLGKNADVNVLKIHDALSIKEQTKINLNGKSAKIKHLLKTISKNNEKYDFLVYHNNKDTFSNIVNNGVNIKEGVLTFNLSSFAPNHMTNCNINQNSRIVNLTKNKCQINPNLFIDENDVIANHSAYVGSFSMDEIFYLMSRGISKEKAENLMIKGFLLNDVNFKENEFEEIINKYWR